MTTPNRLSVLREDPKTSRVGTNWTPDEDTSLFDQVKQGMDYEKIALEHQRTTNSVKTRVVELYLKKIANKELTLEEASEAVHLPVTHFTAAQRRREQRHEIRKKPQPVSMEPKPATDDVMSLLKEINGKMDLIINSFKKET
jgi:hypothetical protein